MQYPDDERRELLKYSVAPTLDRDAVARYALGDRSLAGQILAPLRTERFKRIWSGLTELALPALGIEVQEGLARTRSRVGGLPDLPSGMAWPKRGEKPLVFVCQLDLAEVQQRLRDPAIPSAGLLSFFYEADEWTSGSSPEDRGAWSVLLLQDPVSPQGPPDLALASRPSGYDPATWGFQEAGVVLAPRISLPDKEHVLLEGFELSAEDWDAYGALLDELRKAHEPTQLRDGSEHSHLTQFLGYPAEIQHDPFITTQLASHGIGDAEVEWESDDVMGLLGARSAWRLLLQVDSISEIGMDWADGGLLYYSIREEDLHARQWENSWLVMESL